MMAMAAKMLLVIKYFHKCEYSEIIASCLHSQLLAKHATNGLVKALIK